MTRVPAEKHPWGPRQWLRVRLFSLAFLAFLAYPVGALLSGGAPTGKVLAGLIGMAAFVACYVRVMWQAVPVPYNNQTPYTLAATFVVGAALIAVLGFGWLTAFAFYGNALLVFSGRRRWRLAGLSAVTGGYVLIGLAISSDVGSVLGAAASVLAVGGVQVAFARQIEDGIQLRQARAELARLAVAEERLRISRDLHDVLGQRLAAVALKSELATRLLREHPDRAETEMIEVGKIAREALDEVRATVSGYRDVSLATEVHTAVAILGAAGVETTVSGVPVGLPRGVEEVAAWVVREATTNVIRHARASRCRVAIGRVAGALTVEIGDDGVASSGEAPVKSGNGLTGLTERVVANGGSLSIGAVNCWFTVRATVPAGASS